MGTVAALPLDLLLTRLAAGHLVEAYDHPVPLRFFVVADGEGRHWVAEGQEPKGHRGKTRVQGLRRLRGLAALGVALQGAAEDDGHVSSARRAAKLRRGGGTRRG
jgi:hypothetical protein